MSIKLFSAAVLASIFLAGPALAQSAPPAQPRQPATAARDAGQTIKPDQWRSSKLAGLNVYNANNEKIGDIKEIIVGASGRVDFVVVGVGGFLGIGEHNVALAWNQVKFTEEPMKTSSSTDGVKTTGTGTRTGAAVPRDYPDHAVVSMNKDQLKAMPAFKFAGESK
jgi:hypothetical protein